MMISTVLRRSLTVCILLFAVITLNPGICHSNILFAKIRVDAITKISTDEYLLIFEFAKMDSFYESFKSRFPPRRDNKYILHLAFMPECIASKKQSERLRERYIAGTDRLKDILAKTDIVLIGLMSGAGLDHLKGERGAYRSVYLDTFTLPDIDGKPYEAVVFHHTTTGLKKCFKTQNMNNISTSP